MFAVKEFGETYHGVEWSTNLVAHVFEESVLNGLRLLCLLRFHLQ